MKLLKTLELIGKDMNVSQYVSNVQYLDDEKQSVGSIC